MIIPLPPFELRGHLVACRTPNILLEEPFPRRHIGFSQKGLHGLCLLFSSGVLGKLVRLCGYTFCHGVFRAAGPLAFGQRAPLPQVLHPLR